MPSLESILRHFLYGNHFFQREFGKQSEDFLLPDCFGFPASLPTIMAHGGLKGFSTQKLTWGSAVGIPFNVGVWIGPDGSSVLAALNPGGYGNAVTEDLSNSPVWLKRIEATGAASGVFADFHYFGIGDKGRRAQGFVGGMGGKKHRRKGPAAGGRGKFRPDFPGYQSADRRPSCPLTKESWN